MKVPLLVLSTGLVAVSGSILEVPPASAPSAPPSTSMTYSGVVDAGSTGTRLNIYGFVDGHIKHQGLFTNTPGLAEVASDGEIRDLLREIFQHAEPFYSNIRKIPIGFYGTAGFRMLDKSRADQVLRLVEDELKEYNLKEAKVISGEEEGRLALMALVLSKGISDDTGRSIGIIDMGGKSAQVSVLERNGDVNSKSMDLGIMAISTGDKLHECQAEDHDKQRTCARQIISGLGGLRRMQGLNDIEDLYLLSYLHDEFGKIVRNERTTMREVKDRFYEQCSLLSTNKCRNMFYLISFVKALGITDDKSLHHIDTNNGINITWASGKGYELDKRYSQGPAKH